MPADQSLKDLLSQNIEDESLTLEPEILLDSPYFDDNDTINILKGNQGLSIYNSNIQCLNAKFHELQIYLANLENNNARYDVICLQETWLSKKDCTDMFDKIPGYKLVPKPCSASTKGGLATYVRKDLQYEVIKFAQSTKIWEQLIIKITGLQNGKVQ